MNILFVSHEDKLFGASKSLINLIDEFRDKHNCIVVTRSVNGDFSKELIKRGVRIIPARYYTWEIQKKSKGLDFRWISHCIFWRLFGRILDKLATRKIKNQLDCKIDIIHTNSGVVDLGLFLKKELGCPLVWHLREFGFEDFGYKPYFKENRFYAEIDKADGIIAISDAIQRKFEQHLSHDKIKRIYNGVDTTNLISNKKYHLENNEKLVLLISGSKISVAKGQKLAIDAVKLLNNKGISNIELRIAGYGDLSEIGIYEIPENIVFLGHVNNMVEQRSDVDIELVCSRCEAFGRVTVEAMLGGIPVIGANTGGTPELIKDSYNGFVFQYGDPEDLADKILFFYNHREKIKIMGRNAQEYAIENFLIGRCAKEVEEFYDELLQRS